MAKLTDTQRLVLASASEQAAGLATRPEKLNAAAAAKVAASLLDRGYMRECGSKPGQPIWRKDVKGKPYSLKILKAGRVALNATGEGRTADTQRAAKTNAVAIHPAQATQDAPRPSSKIAGILDQLGKTEGASASEMIASTGWLPHTLRAALTGLRKRGYVIERTRKVDGAMVYRLGSDTTMTAAA